MSAHSKRSLALALIDILGVVACIALLGRCGGDLPPICPPAPTPPPTATPCDPCPICPPAEPTATPTPGEPTPRPSESPTPPVSAIPYRSGVARYLLSDVLRPDYASLDYWAVLTMGWSDPGLWRANRPALELSLRGTAPAPCLTSPCGPSAVGLVARWSANVEADNTQPDEDLHCGDGINYHRRLAIGPLGPGDSVVVEVEWEPSRVRVCTPVDCWESGRVPPDSAGFATWVPGVPEDWDYWAREAWSDARLAALIGWTGTPGPDPVGCP